MCFPQELLAKSPLFLEFSHRLRTVIGEVLFQLGYEKAGQVAQRPNTAALPSWLGTDHFKVAASVIGPVAHVENKSLTVQGFDRVAGPSGVELCDPLGTYQSLRTPVLCLVHTHSLAHRFEYGTYIPEAGDKPDHWVGIISTKEMAEFLSVVQDEKH